MEPITVLTIAIPTIATATGALLGAALSRRQKKRPPRPVQEFILPMNNHLYNWDDPFLRHLHHPHSNYSRRHHRHLVGPESRPRRL